MPLNLPNLSKTLLPPSPDVEIRRDVLAALRTLDRTVQADVIDLTVARRGLGRGRGWTVRLMSGARQGGDKSRSDGTGGAILREWRRPTEAAADRVYWAVMRAIGDRPGFCGIVETSSEGATITGDMIGIIDDRDYR